MSVTLSPCNILEMTTTNQKFNSVQQQHMPGVNF